jgi:hypothetical protein
MKYVIALFISLVGVGSSYHFLKPNYELPTNNEKKVAVAQIEYDSDSGVQKMQAGQAFWVDVPNGSQLYQGDSIRTDDETSAKIEFLGSETKLAIQPETRFVVEKKDDKFVVGDIEGNLFVENAKALSDVQIKAGDKTIDVSEGKAQINVSGGEVDLALKGGKVKTSVNGQEKLLSGKQSGKLTDSGFEEKKINFLNVTPYFDQTLYLKNNHKTVEFEWDKVKGNYKFSILIGKNPKKLFPFEQKDVLEIKVNSLKANLPRGTYYWKIVGKDKKNPKNIVHSEIFKFATKTLFNPVLLSPSPMETVKFKKDQAKKMVQFSWKSASPIENSFIEIAADKDFKQVLFSDETSKKSFQVDMAQGTYYWRVTTNLKGSKQYIKTPMGVFNVKYFNGTFPPKLILPVMDKNIVLAEKQKKTDLNLNWERVAIADKYRVLLTTKSGKKPIRIDKDVKDPSLFLQNLEPGTYEWKVASIDKEGEVSKFSKPRVFSVRKPEQIEWLMKSDLYEYVKAPDVKIGWSKTNGVKKWKIEYAPNQNFQNSINEVVNGNAVKLPIRLDGVYYLRVYALNEDEKIIAKSPIKAIQVREKPLPTPPKFKQGAPERFIASTSGKLNIAFKPLNTETDRIILKVIDQNGEVIRLHRMRSVQEVIQGLMPGKYFISAQTEDKYERRSLPSDSKELEVPELSYVKAPEIDNIIIK